MGNPLGVLRTQRRYRVEAGKRFDRTPEPMVMDGEPESRAYDRAGRTSMVPAYRVFTKIASALLPRGRERVLVADFGSGPANLLVLMARALASAGQRCRIVGSELSRPMADLAAQNIAAAGLAQTVSVEHADCTADPFVQDASADLATSLWVAHQLPGASRVVDLLRRMHRTVAPGRGILLADFLRPPTTAIVDMLVRYTGSGIRENDADYANSLRAAFSPEEWPEIVRSSAVPDLRLVVMQPLPVFVVVYRAGVEARGEAVDDAFLPAHPGSGLSGLWDRVNARINQRILERGLRSGGLALL